MNARFTGYSCPLLADALLETVKTLKKKLLRTFVNLHDGNLLPVKGLFTWSGGPRASGVGFFCFHALEDTKQKKPTPLDRGLPLHVNRVLLCLLNSLIACFPLPSRTE